MLEVSTTVFKTFAGWLANTNPASFVAGPMIEPVFRLW
jgi:hypothetical protein